MTDGMASLSVDVHPFNVTLAWFRDGNCFLIASVVTAYSGQQMLLMVEADRNTQSLRNAFYNSPNSRFDITFQGIWAETNSNMM